MNLKQIILSKLRREHRGIENAIIRQELLSYCQYYDFGITDRELRKIVKTIPQVCNCEKGYFIPKNLDEVRYAVEYLKKKIFPLWDDIKRIQEAYPEYFKEEQLELPL